MSPQNIVDKACSLGLDIIGIADHNSTRQAPLIQQLGKANGLFVLCGAEVTTKEEAHCLAFMPDESALLVFQDFLDAHLPNVPNDPDKMGFQIVVDADEEIVFEEDRWLVSAIDVSIDDLYDIVHDLKGILIPAHVDKKSTSLMSQLGFIPPDLRADAIELTKFTTPTQFVKLFAYLKKFGFIQSSDAHYIDIIGETYTLMELPHRSFETIREWLHKPVKLNLTN